MEERCRCGGRGWLIPLLLIVLGALFLLDNAGYLDAGNALGTWWPLLLVFFGLGGLCRGKLVWGLMLLVAGTLLQLDELDCIAGDVWGYAWPAALILLGLLLLVRPRRPAFFSRGQPGTTVSQDQVDMRTAFSEAEQRVVSQQFKGGRVDASCGQAVVDMTEAALADRRATLHVRVRFGSVVLRVPQAWKVDVQSGSVAAEVAQRNRVPPDAENPPVLEVRVDAVFSGVEITN